MAGIGNTINGGFYSGTTFPPDTTHFVGVTFEAPCVIPPGSILEDCTFQCYRHCGAFFKRCCPLFSTVGKGAIMKGGTTEYVQFDATDRLSGTSTGPEGNVTYPDCVDCAAWAQQGAAISTTNMALTSGGGTLTALELCRQRNDCTKSGTIIVGGNGRVVCVVGSTTVSG
jgi:hypothetical protein